jgi:hypothetical protein
MMIASGEAWWAIIKIMTSSTQYTDLAVMKASASAYDLAMHLDSGIVVAVRHVLPQIRSLGKRPPWSVFGQPDWVGDRVLPS